MRSNKRKRPTIHPRNRYADNPPDFALLASLYPSFSPYVTYSRDGRPRIDWTDFNATRELTRVLLHRDHGLNWWIPDGQLCPTVPNRSNYIHWIEDLVASDIVAMQDSAGDEVRGFDIGTGANCIYPLLGASLLGWSFVGSDVTDIAIEWAEKNVQSNPHIANLIEIRRVDNVSVSKGNSTYPRGNSPEKASLSSNGMMAVEDLETFRHDKTLDDSGFLGCVDKAVFSEMNNGDIELKPPSSLDEHATVGGSYQGPPILLGVVKDEEKFDFCMCNPPFFESMEEVGLNPKTSCGGTIREMVCTGGERAFIIRIIEDSISLRQTFRWYTSMLGKKSNMKFLTSKLRKAGVTIVKTTEFVQGQTSRWGLAWSFMAQKRKLLPPLVPEKSNFSFLLEGLHRQVSAFSILQSVEFFFRSFGATCKSNPSSFTVDVTTSNEHWDSILKNSNNIDYFQHVTEVPRIAGHLDAPSNQLCFRLSVYQHIPGTLLVKGSLQPKNGPASGSIPLIFWQLEQYLKSKLAFQGENAILLKPSAVNKTS